MFPPMGSMMTQAMRSGCASNNSLDGFEVVVWSDKCVGGEFGVYAGGVGDAGGGESGAGTD